MKLQHIIKKIYKWKEIPSSWVRKMSLLPRLIYRFNVMPVKFPTGFIVHIDKLIPKFIWKCQRPRVSKTTLKKKNEVG